MRRGFGSCSRLRNPLGGQGREWMAGPLVGASHAVPRSGAAAVPQAGLASSDEPPVAVPLAAPCVRIRPMVSDVATGRPSTSAGALANGRCFGTSCLAEGLLHANALFVLADGGRGCLVGGRRVADGSCCGGYRESDPSTSTSAWHHAPAASRRPSRVRSDARVIVVGTCGLSRQYLRAMKRRPRGDSGLPGEPGRSGLHGEE